VYVCVCVCWYVRVHSLLLNACVCVPAATKRVSKGFPLPVSLCAFVCVRVCLLLCVSDSASVSMCVSVCNL